MENQACPCCSALPYRDCCLPPHLGRPAADALALMRSRYAAYVLQLTDYIVATTVPAQQRLLDAAAIAAWSRESQWLGLEVFDFQTLPGGRHALVDFAARFADAAAEKSRRTASCPPSYAAAAAGISSIPPFPCPRRKRPVSAARAGNSKAAADGFSADRYLPHYGTVERQRYSL